MNNGGELKHYEVVFTGSMVVVVKDAPDADTALEWANNEIFPCSFDLDRSEIREIESEEDLESSVRHAHAVSEG